MINKLNFILRLWRQQIIQMYDYKIVEAQPGWKAIDGIFDGDKIVEISEIDIISWIITVRKMTSKKSINFIKDNVVEVTPIVFYGEIGFIVVKTPEGVYMSNSQYIGKNPKDALKYLKQQYYEDVNKHKGW